MLVWAGQNPSALLALTNFVAQALVLCSQPVKTCPHENSAENYILSHTATCQRGPVQEKSNPDMEGSLLTQYKLLNITLL